MALKNLGELRGKTSKLYKILLYLLETIDKEISPYSNCTQVKAERPENKFLFQFGQLLVFQVWETEGLSFESHAERSPERDVESY